MPDVNFREIEGKWRKRWEESKIFEPEVSKSRKFFLTAAYPYVQGPQHIGHARTYSMADVDARFKRMQGYNVLFPMAWHVTGTPILAITKRIREGDEDLLGIYRDIYGVPPETIKSFSDPLKLIDYFSNEIREGMKEMGFSIDWRRQFNTGEPIYSKFIEWQFRQLHEKGLIKKGEHPVAWCPACANAVGEHDVLGDKKAKIEEFTIVKFILKEKGEKTILPAATFRPETIFGATNVWINPDAKYVEALVNEEKWILSKEAAEKMKLQKEEVKIVKDIEAISLVEKKVVVPVTNSEIPIFPASFVNPDNATGIVYSCPAHAPYDWMALRDMGKKFGADKIKPISLVKTEKYGEYPAKEVCENMGIKNQKDARLEEATAEIYKAEFHKGILKENTGAYAGLSVSEAKEKVKKDLIEKKMGDIFFEIMNRPVVCRCNTPCSVKVLKNQWFIDYGNKDWKKKAHEYIDKMAIIPESTRLDYHNTIDWLHERACARRQGLGTHLPMDPEWIIESLSDSTIYMAFYTVSRFIRENNIKPEQLIPEFWDYILLGKHNAEDLADETGIDLKTIKKMRNEFSYWYPLDSRHSAGDLITNHLTFFIMNHIAIFPEALWPRQIVTNGFVMYEGQKMSKSLGNIVPLRKGIAKYGADIVRLSVLYGSSLEQDTNFTETAAGTLKSKISRLFELADEASKVKKGRNKDIDIWILSRLIRYVKDSHELMEKFEYREIINRLLFIFEKDILWYLKRSEERKALPEVMEIMVRMLSPFMPYSCEEIWERLGKKPFVSLEKWPKADDKAIRADIEKKEEYIQNLIEDIRNVVRLSKIEKPFIYITTAEEWKYGALEIMKANKGDVGKSIKDINEKFRDVSPSEIAAFAQYAAKQKMHEQEIVKIDEAKILKAEKDFLEKELGFKVFVNEKREFEKKKSPVPLKPAIYAVAT